MSVSHVRDSLAGDLDEAFLLQARLYAALRRSSGRVVDLVWFRQNRDYARAVLDYADSIADREVRDTARKLRHFTELH